LTPVAIAGARHPYQTAGPPFTDAEADPEVVRYRTLLGRLHQFFRSASWSMCLSKLRSATNCFS
jgi:hypothetical protein